MPREISESKKLETDSANGVVRVKVILDGVLVHEKEFPLEKMAEALKYLDDYTHTP